MRQHVLTVMCGLPSSGKSAYAADLADSTGATIYESKVAYSQENPEDVPNALHEKVKNALSRGMDVIYDAPNISLTARKHLLATLYNINCVKRCIIMATPFEECCKRAALQGSAVPVATIKNLYQHWETPYWFEGWDSIKVIRDTENLQSVTEWLQVHDNFNQENSHHSKSLGDHCRAVGQELRSDRTLYYAGLLHDCGKPFTKDFKNTKGVLTEQAHYYQHHCVGAYDSFFFELPEDVDPLDVSILINLHMDPYFWKKSKKRGWRMQKGCYRLWGKGLFSAVVQLHKADKKAH